ETRMSKLNDWLRGVRVLDLSKFLPGPMAGMLLADMGAEVLKIEAPTGDEMQELGPRDEHGDPVFYRAGNAGKTAQRINIKDTEWRVLRRAGSARAPGVGRVVMERIVVLIALVGFALAATSAAEEPEVYPAKGQTVQQQDRDKFECHEWAT